MNLAVKAAIVATVIEYPLAKRYPTVPPTGMLPRMLVAGGTVLSEFYGISASPGASGSALVTTSADLNSVLALASDYAGTSDILTIAVRTFTGSTASSMYAFVDWLELL